MKSQGVSKVSGKYLVDTMNVRVSLMVLYLKVVGIFQSGLKLWTNEETSP